MINIHILCGGQSTEHEISLRSAQSIINHLDKNKYNVSMSYITKDGKFVPIGKYENKIETPESLMRDSLLNRAESIMQFIDFINTLENPIIIPCIHGTTGEDGQIQGFLKTLNLRFIGNDILSSAICMDKATTNRIFTVNNIPQAKYFVLERKRFFRDEDKESIISNIFDTCGESVFVKPSANGSSIGVHRANRNNIIEAIEDAFNYDDKVVIEEEIFGEELEISVVGNEYPKASLPGSYSTNREFFDYIAKYNDKTLIRNIPHKLNPSDEQKVRELAIDSYIAAGCCGFARVDIFMDKDNNFFVNEINSFPGMTFSSLSAELWQATNGTTYSQLLDELIDLAIKRFENKNGK